MIRHIVNFGLLFSFITLAVTGVLSFVRPFDLPTTRIHIVFGFATLILVGLHLYSRVPYFRQQMKSPSKASVNPRVLVGIVVVWAVLLFVSLTNGPVARQVIEQGYEYRHRQEIVRPSALVAAVREEGEIVASRAQEESDTVALTVHGLLAAKQDVAIAVWAESSNGTLIETLYVTPAMGFSDNPDWAGASVKRGDVLPIWRNRYTLVAGVEPDGSVDGMSGATADHRFSLKEYLTTEGKDFVVCVEINAAADVDDKWTDPVLGQPSVLYTGLIEEDKESGYVLLELTGHGGKGDHAGAIRYDLESITTAGKLLEIAVARCDRVAAQASGDKGQASGDKGQESGDR